MCVACLLGGSARPAQPFGVRVPDSEFGLRSARLLAQAQAALLILRVGLEAQPGEGSLLRRPLADPHRMRGNPCSGLLRRILQRDRVHEHAHAAGLGVDDALRPLGRVRAVDQRRVLCRQRDRDLDPGEPLGLVQPDIGEKALAVLGFRDVDSSALRL
jgi:hypothetical protein